MVISCTLSTLIRHKRGEIYMFRQSKPTLQQLLINYETDLLLFNRHRQLMAARKAEEMHTNPTKGTPNSQSMDSLSSPGSQPKN